MNTPSNEAGRLDVSRETLERLEHFAALLKKWSPAINLVAPGTLPDLWARHILDSVQIFELAPEGVRHWVDLGSGGGLPGAVIAILAVERRPELTVTMIESDQRKAVFLRTVLRECGVSGRVFADRIEKAEPQQADVLSARALAPLTELLGFAERHLIPEGVALFPKGAQAEIEIAAARKSWSFDCDVIPSQTAPEGRILKIGGIVRV